MKAVPLCFDGLLWPCCEPVVTTFPQTIYPHLKNAVTLAPDCMVYVSLKVYAWNKRGFDFLLNNTLHLPGGHFEVEVAEGGRQLRFWQVPSCSLSIRILESMKKCQKASPGTCFDLLVRTNIFAQGITGVYKYINMGMVTMVWYFTNQGLSILLLRMKIKSCAWWTW